MPGPVTAHGDVFKTGLPYGFWVEEIPPVHEDGNLHEGSNLRQVQLAEFFPLGQEKQSLGAACRLIGGGAVIEPRRRGGEHLLGVRHCLRIV